MKVKVEELEQVKNESIMIIKTLNAQNTEKDEQIKNLMEDSNNCLKENWS